MRIGPDGSGNPDRGAELIYTKRVGWATECRVRRSAGSGVVARVMAHRSTGVRMAVRDAGHITRLIHVGPICYGQNTEPTSGVNAANRSAIKI